MIQDRLFLSRLTIFLNTQFVCVCVFILRGGEVHFGFITSLKKTLLLPNCRLLLVSTTGSSVSHCIIQQPWYFCLSLSSTLNYRQNKNKVHSHIQILRQKLRTRTPFCVLHTNLWTVCRRLCVYIYCGSELEGKTACWLSEEGPADSPGPAGVGLKPPADIHTTAAGLIACLSSPKGKASRCCCRCFAAEPSRV